MWLQIEVIFHFIKYYFVCVNLTPLWLNNSFNIRKDHIQIENYVWMYVCRWICFVSKKNYFWLYVRDLISFKFEFILFLSPYIRTILSNTRNEWTLGDPKGNSSGSKLLTNKLSILINFWVYDSLFTGQKMSTEFLS